MGRTVLVTGASGLLGRDIVKAFERAGWRVVGTALRNTSPPSIVKLDLEDADEIERVLDEVKPDVVVHSAANRFPDQCTADPARATAVNAEASSKLASLAFARSAVLLYISTDYVFSGRRGEAPYHPSSAARPTNTYGQTKLAGEVEVLKNTGGLVGHGNVEASRPADGSSSSENADGGVAAVVLRVPLLYGHVERGQSSSAVHALVDAVYEAQRVDAAAGDARIRVDDHAVRYPTCTEDVARVCLDVATLYAAAASRERKEPLPRVLQFSSEQRYTKFEMCEALAGVLGLAVAGLERHDPSAMEDEDGTVRPYDCHLDTGALRGLGISVDCWDFVAWWRRELECL